MTTAYDLVGQTFTQAQSIASSYSGTAQSRLNDAVQVAGTAAPEITAASFYFSPDVVEPNVDIPTTAKAAGFEAFRGIWDETIADLTERFATFIRNYFPDETEYIVEAQSYLSNTIVNGGTGLPAHVEEQIWQRDRSRILRDAERARATTIDSWAARGFPLPPGAAIHAIRETTLAAQQGIADASSKTAIAQAELEQKNIHFAVEHGIKLWVGAMGAASDYIKAIATGPNAAGQIIPSVTDSQAKLISAAADYYRARIAVQELRMKSGQIPAQWYQEANLKNGDLKMEFIKTKVQGASEGARVAGTVAAAAMNALHASAGIDFGQRLNFNYSGDTPTGIPQ